MSAASPEQFSRPHFVVGTGRCGSTLLSGILRTHPSVLSLSELFTALRPMAFPAGPIGPEQFWRVLSEPRGGASVIFANRLEGRELRYPIGKGRFSRTSGIPPISLVCLPHLSDDPDALLDEIEGVVRTFPTDDIGSQYMRLFDWLAARLGKQIWLERSGGSLGWVDALIGHFPKGRFVHLYRDGRACAFSMRTAPFFRLDYIRRSFEEAIGFDPYVHPERLADQAVPPELQPLLPDRFDPEAFRALPIPVAELGRLWSWMIIRGTRHLAALPPEDVLHVCFEQLVEEPQAELSRILGFLKLEEPGDEWLATAAASVEKRPSGWIELPRDEIAELEQACAKGTARLAALNGAAPAATNDGGERRLPRPRRDGLPPGPGRLARPGKRFLEDPEGMMTACQARYGDFFTWPVPGLRRGRCNAVMVSDPAAIKELFRAGAELCQVADSRERVRQIIGDESIFVLDADLHLRRRRLLLPHFHGRAIAHARDLIVEATDRQIDLWPLDERFSLSASLGTITFEVLCRSTFGIDDTDWQAHLRRLIHELIQPWNGPDVLKKEPVRARAALDEVLYGEIARRRAGNGASAGDDVLSLLMAAVDDQGGQLSDRQLHGELMTLMLGAHETTAIAIAWTFQYLLRDPAAVERARQEGLGGKHEYVDAVVKEAIRLKPPVPLISRTLIKPWRAGGYELPTGTVIAPCLYLVNRQPRTFPQPDAFRPERFLEGNPDIDNYTWVPFGMGIRRCVGAAFAEHEMRVVVQRILSRVDVELVEPVVPRGHWRVFALAPGSTPTVLRRRGEVGA